MKNNHSRSDQPHSQHIVQNDRQTREIKTENDEERKAREEGRKKTNKKVEMRVCVSCVEKEK